MSEPRRRKEARPSELTAAALSLFVEKGFAATRLDDIAARAGVSKGTVYLYFESKEDLFKAVIRESIVPAIEQGEALVRDYPGDSKGLLREVLLGWWELIGNTELAGVPKLMICEARNFPEVAGFYYTHVISRGRRLMADVLERGIARGEFRPVKVDTAIDVIFAPLLMMAIWRFSMAPCCGPGGGEDPEAATRYLELHLDLLLKGLPKDPK